MTRLALLILFPLMGCASVGQGIGLAQKGMSFVDVGFDQSVEAYMEAANLLRQHCKGDVGCLEAYSVTDDDVALVRAQAEKMSAGYDKTAEGLDEMGVAWDIMGPQMDQTIRAAKGLVK